MRCNRFIRLFLHSDEEMEDTNMNEEMKNVTVNNEGTQETVKMKIKMNF